MRKNQREKKPLWVTRFREETVSKWHLNPEQYEQTKKIYTGLTLKSFLEMAVPPAGVELAGPNGELAFVRNDSSYNKKNRYTLVLEIPLSLTAAQKREAMKQTSNFFERLYIADTEYVPKGGQFARITRKPYTQTTLEMGDPAKPMSEYEARTIWFHKLKKPYGSSSSQNTIIEKRDSWIRRRYKILRSKYSHKYKSVGLCMTIQEELSRLPHNKFGKWLTKKRNPLVLSIDNIRRIVNTRPKPLS